MRDETAEDQPLPSPRSASEPMAFTRDELLSAGLRTWALFTAMAAIGVLLFVLGMGGGVSALPVAILVGGYAGMISGAASALVLTVLVPMMWLISRALRRQKRIGLHLVVYVLVGVCVAAFTALVAGAVSSWHEWLTAIPTAAALISVPLGWWLAARAALRLDRGILPRRRRRAADADALAEDQALR